MIVKLLTERHLESLSLKGGCRVYTCQNATLFEISCTGSYFNLSWLFQSYFSCHCTDQWGGDNCTEKVNRCQTRNPCWNGAGCVNFNDGFICQCRPFYTGELCETEFNPCALENNPCQNEAECIAPQDGQYRCFCAAGK